MKRIFMGAIVLGALGIAAVSGCIGNGNPATTQPVTAIDFATTQPAYWLDQQPILSVQSDDFSKLWDACDRVARDYLFGIDRLDLREGLMTTKPMTSSQFFEPWRRELQTGEDVAYSSTAAIRRTIRFEVLRNDDGTYVLHPKVLVERETLSEQRLTSVVLSRSAFRRATAQHDLPFGTKESDQGVILQPRYWYLIGRDFRFEKVVADAVEHKLRG
jgi:hypothetical protein